MAFPAAPGKPVRLCINEAWHELAVPEQASLLNVLRNDLQLNGPKFGCGLGECGACSVLVDGLAARACVIPIGGVTGRHVTTLEGLARLGPDPETPLHPVQQAFIDEQAAQCGYCLNGMVIATVALLQRVPRPAPGQIREALSHNLCRCGTHLEILKAVERAVVLMGADRAGGESA